MTNPLNQAIQMLRDPQTIRERSEQLFTRALNDESEYFAIDNAKILPCCEFVLKHAKKENPTLEVPFHSRWRHFSIGNINRVQLLQEAPNFPQSTIEQGRLWYELVLISVLLDAGAGSNWLYHEKSTNKTWSRSEGLAIASFDMFKNGLFSHCKTNKLQATYEGLKNLNIEDISVGMQVNEKNPLLGVEGRSQLINALANVIKENPHIFKDNRLGSIYDYVIEHAATESKVISAPKVLSIILDTFSKIWPGRVSIGSENMGDVWQHNAIKGQGLTNNLIPFHKLSQWLTYSLLEPLQWQGYSITGLEQMTGLAEYRNGGLFIDTNVIIIKDRNLLTIPQKPNSEAIIEWRALTICLLDSLWKKALILTQKSKHEFPLVSFLEAGTWKAGRICAFNNSPDGNPPINIISDGTVF